MLVGGRPQVGGIRASELDKNAIEPPEVELQPVSDRRVGSRGPCCLKERRDVGDGRVRSPPVKRQGQGTVYLDLGSRSNARCSRSGNPDEVRESGHQAVEGLRGRLPLTAEDLLNAPERHTKRVRVGLVRRLDQVVVVDAEGAHHVLEGITGPALTD